MFAELIWVVPFVTLLGAIAVTPLLHKEWWEKYFAAVSIGLAAVIAVRYVLIHNSESLFHTLFEYFSFIALIGSLFVVSGGIHIQVKGESTPVANCIFLFVGACLANFLGTTGASMVLVRPWLRMNKYRLTSFHVVFFIFIVSNVGGGLTPMGDPPLFLGYLRGVPFFWVFHNLFGIWIFVVALLLAVFFVLDLANFKKAPAKIRQAETSAGETWKFSGGHNVFFLFMILAAVFVNHPPYLREALMIAAAVLSYKTTPKQVHESNDFNFAPIREVAILFLGIFITMLPALEWLEHYASRLGIRTPGHFFWGSGILSSVLDNAPTYLNFLSASIGLFVDPAAHPNEKAMVAYLVERHPVYIRAISAGSVFFGAVTYIGNGPNFLVKSIADQFKAKTPGFFGYFFYFSLPILIPIFALVWFLFFRA